MTGLEWTDEQLARAKALRNKGKSWREIGRYFDAHPDSLRRRIDPEFYERSRRADQARIRDRRVKREDDIRIQVENLGACRATFRVELARRMAEIPEDTRSLTARLFGDPIFERSSLYREQMETRT